MMKCWQSAPWWHPNPGVNEWAGVGSIQDRQATKGKRTHVIFTYEADVIRIGSRDQ